MALENGAIGSDCADSHERTEWNRRHHEEVCEFIDGLVSHLVLDGGRLVVAHAGLKERYQGRASVRVRSFTLYGETTGETNEFGLPAGVSSSKSITV